MNNLENFLMQALLESKFNAVEWAPRVNQGQVWLALLADVRWGPVLFCIWVSGSCCSTCQGWHLQTLGPQDDFPQLGNRCVAA